MIWMLRYAGSSLVVRAAVREVFEITKHQGKIEVADVISAGKNPMHVREYRERIAWVGLVDKEPAWEPT